MWIGKRLYFTSDRDGTVNLYSVDPARDRVKQLTFSRKWDVRWASTDHAGRIVLRDDRRPAGLRRARRHRARHLHHGAHRRRRQPAHPGRRRGGELDPVAHRRAGPVRGPGRRLHGADQGRAGAQPHPKPGRPRQAGALVAGRQDHRLRIRHERRGGGLPGGPGGQGPARTAHHHPEDLSAQPGLGPGRQAPGPGRQGRPDLRGGHRRQRTDPGGQGRLRRQRQLCLVPGRAVPRPDPEQPEREQFPAHLEPGRRQAAPGHRRPVRGRRARLGPRGPIPLLPVPARLPLPDVLGRVRLRGHRQRRHLRPGPAQGRAPSLPARKQRGRPGQARSRAGAGRAAAHRLGRARPARRAGARGDRQPQPPGGPGGPAALLEDRAAGLRRGSGPAGPLRLRPEEAPGRRPGR